MKRYFSLFLLLAVILTGCGGKSKTQEPETNILATAAQEMEEQTMPEQTSGIPFDQPVPVAQDNQDAGACNHYDVIPGELTVTAYSDSETGFLKLAARKYEQSHPGTTIIIHEVGAQNGYSKSKYRDIVLTELMGGVSDDIVDVSPLSWVKLADSGKLLDLRQEIPLDSENYYLNVLKVFRELYMLCGQYPQENIYMLQHCMNNQFDKLDYQNLTAASFLIVLLITLLILGFFLLDRRTDLKEG